MPSSNSGFQRLPQAALSRSRFLRLAGGALLPLVDWRLSAAAAANPQLAQNRSAPATKDAAAPGRMGAILVSQLGPVKIHSYLSPADGLLVNTQMIEGPHDAKSRTAIADLADIPAQSRGGHCGN